MQRGGTYEMSTISSPSQPDGFRPCDYATVPPTKIAGYRRAVHADLPKLECLIRRTTREIYGDVNLGRLYETSCLSVVQYNEKHDVVSGICLCNYPNVPSVPAYDWLTWLRRIYGILTATERNTLFVHSLVWDERYSGHFLKDLLIALFDITTYCQHVILVVPPRVTPEDPYEREMARVLAKGTRDTDKVQFLYLSARRPLHGKLRIRKAVEEDNDDATAIIDGESTRLKEFYGEYYISEMIRFPDGRRQLIVGEDTDGSTAGVMCLNSAIDVDLLNEKFELASCNGLRKPHESDEVPAARATSELLRSMFRRGSQGCMEAASRDLHNDASRAIKLADDKRSAEKSGSNEEIGDIATNAQMKIITVTPIEVSLQPEESGAHAADDVDDSETLRAQTDVRESTESSIGSSESRRLDRLYFEESAKSSVSDDSRLILIDDLSSPTADFDVNHSKTRSSVVTNVTSQLPQTGTPVSNVDDIHNILPRPVYYGEINAFVVEIIAMRKERRPHWYHDFLEAVFDCFPDLEYCVILLPSSCPYLPFLQHFTRVPLRCNEDFPMNLYMAHRAALLGEMKCRRGEVRDRGAVAELLLAIPTQREILATFDLAMHPSQLDLDCFVFECNNVIIGIAILCAEKEVDFIKSRYHIEDYISMISIPRDGYGCFLHFVLMPIFSAYHRFFIREIARLSELTVIFYRLHRDDESALTRMRPLISCLNVMIPVNPRGQVAYRFPSTSENIDDCDAKKKGKRDDAFSLFMTSPRLAMIPPVIIDTKIVVIGASDCGIAFAEYLSLRSARHCIQFTNLTLISPHGLPFDNERSCAETRLLPFKGRYCQEYRRFVAARAWINVVYGIMIAINRKEKYVTVMNQGNLTYDYLVLTCGLQYHAPTFQEETKAHNTEIPLESEIPWNCFTVNDDTEVAACLTKIRLLTNGLKERKIIVFYGHNIDCYCALHGLIEFGVNPSWITLIEPSLNNCETHDHVFSYNSEVDTVVMNAILQSGVRVLSEWNATNWALIKNEDGRLMIESVTIEKGERSRTLACDALFNFDKKTIRLETFLAFCRAGLVFDGLLVIDPECRTNDPFIFAAGTVTKYSRKYYVEFWQHERYSSVEVGERLAEILRKIIDVRDGDDATRPSRLSSTKHKVYLTVPVFRAPTVIACVLPGGYHYLHVRKPGEKALRRAAIGRGCYGEALVTGSCTSEIGYFRIRLNVHDTVETVACVNRKEFQVSAMVALYGKHESMLNELKLRFRNSSIVDLYAYFREPWAAAIFYDRFECLRVENRATLLSRAGDHSDSLVDECMRALIGSKWEMMPEKDRRRIESGYARSVYHQELENNLVSFLEFYEDDLPMYCTLNKQRQMYTDVEESPLFYEQ